MAPLAPDKQRRLCLTDAHRICATFTAARQQAVDGGRLEAEGPGAAAPLLGNDPDGTTVTRWSLVRTTPVLLDQRRVPVQLGSLARDRRSPQLMLGGIMVLAFLALVATRLSGPTTPAAADGTASPRASPTAAATSTPRPTARRTATPPPSIAPTGSVVPVTPAPTAAPTVAPTRTPPPATRSYTVRAGDTLYAIAIRFGTTVQAIRDLNGLGGSSNLHIGQVLRIP
jgi:LysM repeat protein